METATAFLNEHPWILTSGYFGMFVLFLVDGGPVTTALGGFLARAGFFNIWLIFLLSVLGNFIPDILFYWIGVRSRAALHKWGPRFGITKERMVEFERWYELRPALTIFVVKNIPFIPAVGLAAAGAAGMSLKRYVFWVMINIIPTSALFVATGYYAGEAYMRTVRYQVYALMGIALAFFVISWGYRKFSAKLAKKVAPGEV